MSKKVVLAVQGDRVLALIDTRKATELAVKREAARGRFPAN